MAEWIEQEERSNPFTLKLICWIALNLSRRFARLWLWPISLYFYISSPKVRTASREYLKRIPGKQGNILEVFSHIYCFSAIVLDRVYFLTDQFDRFDITIHNENLLHQAMSENRGVLLLGTHVGSFDALRCLAIGRKKLPLKILMYQDHNAMITRILDELNPSIAQSIINLAEPSALLQMKEALDAGNLVGMLGDRVLEDEKKVSCKLLGDKVTLPAGPFTLALMLGVPVIGFFGIYKGANRYEVHHTTLYAGEKFPRNKRQTAVEELTQNYVDNIEAMIKENPYNWFNFYDYWGDNKQG